MSESYIYSGIWTNWTRGRVFGWTLTLPSAQGQLLVAFLAVFVTAAGARAWFITSYFAHQVRAASHLRDRRHHQSQVILRNTGSALVASWEFLTLERPRAKLSPSKFWGVHLLAVLGLLHASCWAAAGVFSSRVTYAAGHEVLIRSPSCGYYNSLENVSLTDASWFLAYRNLNATRDASTYSRLCYGDTSNKQFCSQYTVPRIPWTSDASTTCPFDANFCRLNGTSAAVTMDTGMLNSQSIFGFNTPPSDEIGFRKVTTCAPIRAPTGFQEFVHNTSSNGDPGSDTWLRFYFGPTSATNWTWAENVNTSSGAEGYQLQTMSAFSLSSANKWDPIPQLNRTDADISLFLLSANGITYNGPVDDPWFSAHIPIEVADETFYQSDSYVRFLGCTDRVQYCNLNPASGSSLCTPLTGMNPAFAAARKRRMGFSETQLIMAGRFAVSLPLTPIIQSATSEASLQAYNSVWNGLSGPLPETQWQIEAAAWFNIALAKLQALLVEVASGPLAPSLNSVIKPPFGPVDAALCNAQKVRQNAGHISFSVLGLVIIFVSGGVIIVVSFIIDIVVGFLQRRLRLGSHKVTQWLTDEKLQLQRLLHEHVRTGQVDDDYDQVPVTAESVEHKGVVYTTASAAYPMYGNASPGMMGPQ